MIYKTPTNFIYIIEIILNFLITLESKITKLGSNLHKKSTIKLLVVMKTMCNIFLLINRDLKNSHKYAIYHWNRLKKPATLDSKYAQIKSNLHMKSINKDLAFLK